MTFARHVYPRRLTTRNRATLASRCTCTAGHLTWQGEHATYIDFYGELRCRRCQLPIASPAATAAPTSQEGG